MCTENLTLDRAAEQGYLFKDNFLFDNCFRFLLDPIGSLYIGDILCPSVCPISKIPTLNHTIHGEQKHFNTTTLQHCNTTTLQHCTTTTLQHYKTTTLQHYNTTTLQHYNSTTLQHYNTTTLQQQHYITTTLQYYNLTESYRTGVGTANKSEFLLEPG